MKYLLTCDEAEVYGEKFSTLDDALAQVPEGAGFVLIAYEVP